MSKTQKRNTEHVEQVMYERGCALWDDNAKKYNDKYSNKSIFRRALLFIILPLSLIFIPLIISDHSASVARKKKEQEEQLSSCLALASHNYWISQEMEDAADGSPELSLVLVKRRKAGIEAKIKCHEDYGSNDKSSINALEADKTEAESLISLYESEIRDANSQPAPNYTYNQTPTHCTSQRIGLSIYTNCY